ncbi:hypothetical protein E2C06_12385 [Dankookia rubra]|uniref:Uncharacterized protein n=1 Tax=Dankookia rubra TaxID=1442381 RepID=A0A4R5QHZ0_9PROT|nr:hypothetical protein [Dankookia rubra]TDH62398.1 hypothetical protein E2C06_12385 [Dankookia rubra]
MSDQKIRVERREPTFRGYILENAIDSDFQFVELVSVQPDGQVRGSLRPDFMMRGLLGSTNRSVIIIGLKWDKSRYKAQEVRVEQETLEQYLRSLFEGFPWVRLVEYSEHDYDNSFCYVANVEWLSGTWLSFREKIEAHYGITQKFYLDTPSEPPHKHARRPFTDRATEIYLERRRLVKPDAVELKLSPDQLPKVLGLGNQETATDAAKAAFGINHGVESAIYVRLGYGPKVSSDQMMAWVQRTSHYADVGAISMVSPGERLTGYFWRPEEKMTYFSKGLYFPNVFKLGGNVFQTLDAIDSIVSDPKEIFRGDHIAPASFDQARFASALRELVVNGFSHGYWRSNEESNRDDTEFWSSANSIAVAHLENRLEVINRQHPARGDDVGRFRKGHPSLIKSTLHAALQDIDLAKGRGIGLKLVQARVMKLGMPCPVVLDTLKLFRVVLPFTNEFESWVMPKQKGEHAPAAISYFVLKLCKVLMELDAEIVASALNVSLAVAARTLAQLAVEEILVRSMPREASFYSRGDYPHYSPAGKEILDERIASLASEMRLVRAPPLMSPAGLCALSVRAGWFSVPKDIRNSIWRVLNEEGVYRPDTEIELADDLSWLVEENRSTWL